MLTSSPLHEEDLGYAVNRHTINYTRKVVMAIKKENDRRKRRKESLLRPAHQLVPWTVALWNIVKRGQDVVSQMLKNVKIDFCSLHPRSFIFI